MEIMKAICRGFFGLLALLVACCGVLLGLLLCATIVGLVPGVLVLMGSLGLTAWVINLWGKPEASEQVRGLMSSLRLPHLAPRRKV